MVAAVERPTTGGGRPDSYKCKDGKRVPGVTSITSRCKDADALIAWANKEGLEGRNFRESRDVAAGIGHHVHALIDAVIHERALPDPPRDMSTRDVQRANQGLESFRTWSKQANFRIVDTESPAVCEVFRFGGTRDWLAYCYDELVLGDLKSGRRVYREHLAQLAAYRHLARKQGHGVRSAILLRVGKEFGDFSHHYFPEAMVDLGWEWFARALNFYECDKQLKEAMP